MIRVPRGGDVYFAPLGPGSQTEVENVGVVRKMGIVNLGRCQDLVEESALSAEDGVPKASQRSRCITEKGFLSEIGTEQDSLQIDHERTSFGHRRLRRRRGAVSHPYLLLHSKALFWSGIVRGNACGSVSVSLKRLIIRAPPWPPPIRENRPMLRRK